MSSHLDPADLSSKPLRSKPITTVAAALIFLFPAQYGAAITLAPSHTSIIETAEGAAPFKRSAIAINAAIRQYHYDPKTLSSSEYRTIEAKVLSLGDTAQSQAVFLSGFRSIWRGGPFSHVALLASKEPASQSLKRIDTQPAGSEAVTLSWHGSTAVLTVNTMSGPDTVRSINAAYREIARRDATRLIIDLRANLGGAFAVVPLIGHLIRRPVDIGVFVSALWYRSHKGPPTKRQLRQARPWKGYSVVAFQQAMLHQPLTGYRIP